MLIIGGKSIKDIAFSLSFNEISYFYRLFKKVTGKSPHQYTEQSSLERKLEL